MRLSQRRRGAAKCHVKPRLRFEIENEHYESERIVCERPSVKVCKIILKKHCLLN